MTLLDASATQLGRSLAEIMRLTYKAEAVTSLLRNEFYFSDDYVKEARDLAFWRYRLVSDWSQWWSDTDKCLDVLSDLYPMSPTERTSEIISKFMAYIKTGKQITESRGKRESLYIPLDLMLSCIETVFIMTQGDHERSTVKALLDQHFGKAPDHNPIIKAGYRPPDKMGPWRIPALKFNRHIMIRMLNDVARRLSDMCHRFTTPPPDLWQYLERCKMAPLLSRTEIGLLADKGYKLEERYYGLSV